jgi:hypothetical protein
MGRHKIDREPRRKAVKLRIAPRESSGKVTEPYQIMEKVLATDRQDLAGVNIAIAWHTGWRPDADGVRIHGKAVKHSELEHDRSGFDWTLELSEPVWKALSERDKLRLIMHELAHIHIASDKNGTPWLDDKNRVVTRTSKHDVADFKSIIQKFGLPENLQECDIADGDRPLLKLAKAKQETTKAAECDGVGPGWPIKLKFQGLKGCKGSIDPVCQNGRWYAGYELQLGNLSIEEFPFDSHPQSSRMEALRAAKDSLHIWLVGLIFTGTANAKRAMQVRRDMMWEQLDQQLDAVLNAAAEATPSTGAEEQEPEEA